MKRSRNGLGFGVALAGLFALVLAAAWWWIVYSRVVDGAYLSYREAVPCLFGSSDLCSLAQSLCRTDHFLGIRRYSVVLFWGGLGLAGAGLFLAAGGGKPGRPEA